MTASTASTSAVLMTKPDGYDADDDHTDTDTSSLDTATSSPPPQHQQQPEEDEYVAGGLTSAEALARLARVGPNALTAEAPDSVWVVFALQFANLIIALLLAAALACVALREYVEGVAIIAIVTLNAAIATMQERRAGHALAALSRMAAPQCFVVRDHRAQRLASDQLVPGDLVLLTTGDVVPADLRVLSATELRVNEMLLTGEAKEVAKLSRPLPQDKEGDEDDAAAVTDRHRVFSSTSVASGRATGLVEATGMHTRVGRIAALLQQSQSSQSSPSSTHGRFSPRDSVVSLDSTTTTTTSVSDRDGSADEPLWTRFLRACRAAHARARMTPLQHALHQLGVAMGVAVVGICVVVFTVGLLRGHHDPKDGDRPVWLTMVMIAVSLAVSAVPEGLPMVVTICLSTGTAEMVHRQHVLVRQLAAVETLGASSVICTDKTGTLTEGEMTAVRMYGDGHEYELTGTGFAPYGEVRTMARLRGGGVVQNEHNNVQVHTTLLAAVLCSNTTLTRATQEPAHAEEQVEEGEDVDGEDRGKEVWTPRGNATEAPLVVAAAKLGLWGPALQAAYPRVAEVPFTSTRKLMATITEVGEDHTLGKLRLPAQTTRVAHLKGAPPGIVPHCTQFVRKDGAIADMHESDRAAILEAVEAMSLRALRVLAIAIHPLTNEAVTWPLPLQQEGGDGEEGEEDDGDSEGDALLKKLQAPLVFLGLVGCMDPPRAGVRRAIQTARAASVRTVMITGDQVTTALSVARLIGLVDSDDDDNDDDVHVRTDKTLTSVTPGDDDGGVRHNHRHFQDTSVAVDCAILRDPLRASGYRAAYELDEIVSWVAVFAHATPADKLVIVRSLQRQGHVVAMTGDGVNDAPALQQADIGVAMGRSGTEVARGAADMILTDDNFCSIVAAIEKGRVIYANIQKFVCFLLSTNFGEISIIFVAIAVGMPNPLEPLQILVLNLFADGMAAVALSLERGDPHGMLEPPRRKTEPIVHGRLWGAVLTNAFLIGTGALLVFATGLYWNFQTILLDNILDGATTVEDYQRVVCFRYEQGTHDHHWKMYANCGARHRDGSLVFASLLPGTTDYVGENMECHSGEYECLTEGVARAQTMLFVYITTMEMLRAYTARSFTTHVWVGAFSNPYMQLAAMGSIVLTLLVTLVPVISDQLFGFAHIEGLQWAFAMGVAIASASLGEVLKCMYRRRDRRHSQGTKPCPLPINNVLQFKLGDLETRLGGGVTQGVPVRLDSISPNYEGTTLINEQQETGP